MAGNEIKGEMIRGHVDTFILLSLCDGDKDSNSIKAAIEQRSDNKFTVKQGTFYSAMQRLVKQKYINEYRSSASDGIRRKYYSLTKKGNEFLDKNREEWTKSRELIDNLIETPSEPVAEPEIVKESVVDEFDEFKKLVEQNADGYTFFAPDDTDDSYLDRLGSEVLNDLSSELDSTKSEYDSSSQNEYAVVAENDSDENNSNESGEDNQNNDEDSEYNIYDEILPPSETELYTDAFDDEINDENEIDLKNLDYTGNYTDYTEENDESPNASDDVSEIENNESENDIVYDFELPEEETTEEDGVDSISLNEYNPKNGDTTESENIVKIPIKSEENSSVYETVNEETAKCKADDKYNKNKDDKSNKNNDKDDSLYIEDGTPTNRREYKSLLGRLFPKNDSQQITEKSYKKKDTEQIDFDEYSGYADKDGYDEEAEINKINDDVDFSAPISPEKVVKKSDQEVVPEVVKAGSYDESTVKQEEYDFSDLLKMAKNEGFKVRTSLSTNKFNGNGIFINKLNLHSSLLFYGLIFIEMLVLNFALSGVLGWNFGVKAIIALVPAILPLIMLGIYLASPKRKVREISQFKDAITVFLIITFQLIIVDLCVALFLEVDFNNVKEVLSYIVVPFILIINVPLFAIVKYSLLGSGRYFDETKDN